MSDQTPSLTTLIQRLEDLALRAFTKHGNDAQLYNGLKDCVAMAEALAGDQAVGESSQAKALAEWVESYWGEVITPAGCPCEPGGKRCPLHAAFQGESSPTRFAWLMERYLVSDDKSMRGTKAGTLVYWDGGHAESYTTDPWKAVQWPTKEAAMQACPPEHYEQWGWKYVEHGFMVGESSEAPRPQPELCMNPRCHLMREHYPDECGWPVGEREGRA